MTQRFLEYFVAGEPMPEIAEAEALERGDYVTELVADGIRHLQSYSDRDLALVIYPDATPSPVLAAFHRARYAGLPSWIVSPTVVEGDVKRRSLWTFAATGALEWRSDFVFEPRTTTENWVDGSGKLRGKMVRRYNEHDEEIEAIEYTPDGRVLVHD